MSVEQPKAPKIPARGLHPYWPPLHLPPRSAISTPASLSADAVLFDSPRQVWMELRCRQHAATGSHRLAASCPRGAVTAANGRHASVPAACEGAAVCACARGMRGGRWAVAVARARVAGLPRGPHDDRPEAVLVVGRRLAPFERSCGSEAALSGLGLAWRWLAATLMPGGAFVAALVDTRVPS